MFPSRYGDLPIKVHIRLRPCRLHQINTCHARLVSWSCQCCYWSATLRSERMIMNFKWKSFLKCILNHLWISPAITFFKIRHKLVDFCSVQLPYFCSIHLRGQDRFAPSLAFFFQASCLSQLIKVLTGTPSYPLLITWPVLASLPGLSSFRPCPGPGDEAAWVCKTDHFRYIRIQSKTKDLSTRLLEITTEFVGFIPKRRNRELTLKCKFKC